VITTAWGEAHVLTGIAIQQASEGRWWLALPLAILSHWPIDDLNVGAVARIYHGIGNKWRLALTTALRVPVVGVICYIFWNNPIYMICGLSAWLVMDWEWVLNLFGKHGVGLHKNMWPKWLHSEWGLLPWFIVFSLLCWLVW